MTLPLSQQQRRLVKRVYRKALQSHRVKQHMRGSEYAEKYITIPEETRGGSGKTWVNRKFQVCPLDMQVSDQVSEIWWQKSARTGATKIMCIGMMQHATHLKRNVGGYFPDDNDRDKFTIAEMNPLIRDCKVIHEYLRSSGKTDSTNKLALKMFYGSMWELLGGHSESNFRGRSPDTVWADEMSAFLVNIGKGGSVEELLDGRVTESVMPKKIGYSSPKVLPLCQVSSAYSRAQIQLQFYIPCPHCGFEQVMQDFGLDSTEGLMYEIYSGDAGKSAATARYRCHDCSKEFDFATARRQQTLGRWRTFDGDIWHDDTIGKLVDANGVLPGRWTVGMQSNILISPVYGFKKYVHRKLNALAEADGGDDSKIITFTQTRDGMPTSEKALESLNAVELQRLAEYYPPNDLIPQGVEVITMFTDVHKRRFEYLICGWGAGEECWCLEYGIITGEIVRQQPWDRLKSIIKTSQFVREDGNVMNIFLHGIDHGGHWPDMVEEFCRDMGSDRSIPMKGEAKEGKQMVTYPRKANEKGVYLTTVNTDVTKTITSDRLTLEKPKDESGNVIAVSAPGAIHFPQPVVDRYQLFNGQFYKELSSEVKKLVGTKWKWVQQGKNEAWDCLCGNLALIRVCQLPQYGIVLGENQPLVFDETEYSTTGYDPDKFRNLF